jgi:hypothetical protein
MLLVWPGVAGCDWLCGVCNGADDAGSLLLVSALVSRLLVLRYSCRLLVWHALFACSFALLVVAQQCRGPTVRLRRLRPHMRSFPRSIAPSMK